MSRSEVNFSGRVLANAQAINRYSSQLPDPFSHTPRGVQPQTLQRQMRKSSFYLRIALKIRL